MRNFWIIVLSILFIVGCSKDECSTERQVAMCIEDLGCSNSSLQPRIDISKEFELIRSQEDFELAFDSTCPIDISWTGYDLVVGKTTLTSGLSGITKHTIMDCETNQLNLFIEIQTNLTTVAPEILWNALIPKLADNETLFIQIDINN